MYLTINNKKVSNFILKELEDFKINPIRFMKGFWTAKDFNG